MNGFHQYVHRVEPGHPVTEAVLQRGRMLRRLGLRSETYADEIPKELSRLVRPAKRYAWPASVPLLFQIDGPPPKGHLLPPSTRIVLAASALRDDPLGRLAAWADQLGTRIAAVVAEGADDEPPLQPGWHFSPPVFGSDSVRRAPILPAVPIGRRLLLANVGRGSEAQLIAIAEQAMALRGQPVDLALLDCEGEGTAPMAGGRLHRFAQPTPAARAGLFRRADLFLWPPDQEQLRPLTALAFGLPVLAAATDSARQLLGQRLFAAWTPAEVAREIDVLLSRRDLRQSLSRTQADQRAALEAEALATLATLARELGLRTQVLTLSVPPSPSIAIEGSFETSYSLDVTNRGLARALHRRQPGQVALWASHGKGDYWPKSDDLAHHPDLIPLWRGGRRSSEPEVVLRGMYPPRVADMRGRRKLLYFAWEESTLAPEWVAEFNRCLDGIAVVSRFVRKVLIDSGVQVPIEVIGNGVDQIRESRRETCPEPLPKGFKFLHVSSAFPRKGIDVLLRSFASAFGPNDGVSLVLKTFPNEHHDLARDLETLKRGKKALAPIALINRDLPPGQLIDLYHRCDALVAPSRAEGYGLPVAEAMAIGLPVITTGYSGPLDFCDSATARLVDYRFAPAQSHLGLFDSVWAEPDEQDLARALRQVAGLRAPERLAVAQRAKRAIDQEHTWNRVAERLEAFLARLPSPATRPLRIGLSGVQAEANHEFAARLAHEAELNWAGSALGNASLLEHFAACDAAVLGPRGLGRLDLSALLRSLHERGIPSVVFLDSPQLAQLAPMAADLALASRLLVHSVEALNQLKTMGLIDNATLFPRGAAPPPADLATGRAAAWCEAHAWPAIASRLVGMIRGLRAER